MQREEIVFTENESKKQVSSEAFKGGHSSNDLSESEIFQLVRAPLSKLLQLFTFNSSSEHLPFLSFLFVNF